MTFSEICHVEDTSKSADIKLKLGNYSESLCAITANIYRALSSDRRLDPIYDDIEHSRHQTLDQRATPEDALFHMSQPPMK